MHWFYLDTELGAKYNLNDKLNLFVRVKGLRDFRKNKGHFEVLGGIAYNFKDKKTRSIKEESRIIDADKDRVFDNLEFV